MNSLFWAIPRGLNFFANEDGTDRVSETSVNKIQTTGNHPKEIIQH
jgi:hypothetical protein